MEPQENSILSLLWALSAHLGGNTIFLVNPFLSLFSVHRFLLLSKISEKKLMKKFREKLIIDVERQMYG